MRLNLFPVIIQADDQQFKQARYYGTDTQSEIWILGGDGKPVVAASGAGLVRQARGVGDRMTDGARARWVLELADGARWLVSPSGGCGCSHPLKRFDPSKAERVAVLVSDGVAQQDLDVSRRALAEGDTQR